MLPMQNACGLSGASSSLGPHKAWVAGPAYRGDKLTKRVWQQIMTGDYVAQTLVPPSDRLISRKAMSHPLKFDVRNYVYDGAVQFITARLYQGQTTNFRTPGGGFAPVFTESETSTATSVESCTSAVVYT